MGMAAVEVWTNNSKSWKRLSTAPAVRYTLIKLYQYDFGFQDVWGFTHRTQDPLIKEYTLNTRGALILRFKVYSLIKGPLGISGQPRQSGSRDTRNRGPNALSTRVGGSQRLTPAPKGPEYDPSTVHGRRASCREPTRNPLPHKTPMKLRNPWETCRPRK